MSVDTSAVARQDEPYAPGSAQLRNVRRFNRVSRRILDSPVHRLMSNKLLLISFVGRKTGKTYTTPIAYIEDSGRLLIAAGGRWRENLRSHPDVRVKLRGQWLPYRASVVGEGDYEGELRCMAAGNPIWARFSGLELDRERRPTSAALARARARGMTLVRLTPA
jgi:deazaflavin-dependent oxidoreductase (nitroreductase family)